MCISYYFFMYFLLYVYHTGIILVHDSTNKKSYENLRNVWLPEVLAHGKKSSSATGGGASQRQ